MCKLLGLQLFTGTENSDPTEPFLFCWIRTETVLHKGRVMLTLQQTHKTCQSHESKAKNVLAAVNCDISAYFCQKFYCLLALKYASGFGLAWLFGEDRLIYFLTMKKKVESV